MLQTNENAYEGHRSSHLARLSLSTEPASVAEGRQFVRDVLSEWGMVSMREAVVLVASELITNTLLHTDSPPTVQLSATRSGIRLEIEDESGTHPRQRTYAVDATTGRGMMLVDSMASRWGTEARSTGKVVWCEFDCRN
jgi:anti-sigma regulatory factor (Ser/Thr protein kinase)